MIPEIFSHRSIRSYLPEPVPEEVLRRILEAGVRASTTGNMQLYSLVVTTSPEIKERLAPCHFNQPMVTQAPVVITFCADIRRFSLWCRQRGAEPQYDNFVWFVNSVIDTILASQNIVLQAENEGLGICYLGTTTYNAQEIAEVLGLPEGVIPVTTLTMGYPDKMPPQTDRLPLEGVVHRERYHDYTPEQDRTHLGGTRSFGRDCRTARSQPTLESRPHFYRTPLHRKEHLLFRVNTFDALKKQGFFTNNI